MKKWFFQIASLAVLLVLTATVALPGASARYVMLLSGVSAGELNFSGFERTDTFYIQDATGDEMPHLWGNDVKDPDGTLALPDNATMEQYGLTKPCNVIYPFQNVSGTEMFCSFQVSFCAMDYTQLKHGDKNRISIDYTVTLEVNRKSGLHETLTITGKLVAEQRDITAGGVLLTKGTESQYQGSATGDTVDYVIYSCVIAPNLDTMTSGTLKKSVNGGTAETATASDFVMGDGDAGECSISLDFGGLIHSKANADACYASIGLVATPVE